MPAGPGGPRDRCPVLDLDSPATPPQHGKPTTRRAPSEPGGIRGCEQGAFLPSTGPCMLLPGRSPNRSCLTWRRTDTHHHSHTPLVLGASEQA